MQSLFFSTSFLIIPNIQFTFFIATDAFARTIHYNSKISLLCGNTELRPHHFHTVKIMLLCGFFSQNITCIHLYGMSEIKIYNMLET